jgi:hypothetical protein
MRRFVAALSASLLLAGCSTTVLETRNGALHQRLTAGKTVVVADVAAPYRGPTENAVVKQLPGAVAAHTLPGAPAADELATAGSGWDSVVVVSIADSEVTFTPSVGDVGTVPGNLIVRADLDVSVHAPGDLRELYGQRLRCYKTVNSVIAFLGRQGDPEKQRLVASSLAPAAAGKAATRLARLDRAD